jgi:hypothetical protein
MRSNPKLTSVQRFRQLVQAQSCAIDAEDPFEVHAVVALGFSCFRCDRRIPAATRIYRHLDNALGAADQARYDGWVVQPPRHGFLTSEALCPDCKGAA